MSQANDGILQWYDLSSDHWLRRVDEPVSPEMLAEITWPIEESVIRAKARRLGMLLERWAPGQYRLWDVRQQVRGRSDPIPVDFTAEDCYVDSLQGVACFLWLCLSGESK